jgi:hypothetical protein
MGEGHLGPSVEPARCVASAAEGSSASTRTWSSRIGHAGHPSRAREVSDVSGAFTAFMSNPVAEQRLIQLQKQLRLST